MSFIVLMPALAQPQPVVPQEQRGRVDAERSGIHDANNIRSIFYNYGMVGDFPPDPGNVDLSVFHSVEVPKGSGVNYGDGITPFVLAKIRQRNGVEAYIMETGYRENQGFSPNRNRVMRFEPRPGYFQPDPAINRGRSVALSNDPRTWPDAWNDKTNDPDDPGWSGSWNGYFGKRPAADLESFSLMDDDFYDAWDYYPDSRDTTRRGLGLRITVRGFQWANPQAANVIFWHYDITNESTTDYDDNIIFGLYMDSGVGGSPISCDGVFESDDDNAFFDKSFGLNLVYTWDKQGHGVGLRTNCATTGYLGYAYLETPGNGTDGIDNDVDGITNEGRDSGPGQLIVGTATILAYVQTQYNLVNFERAYGPIDQLPAVKAGRWWTGDEDMDWVADLHDTGVDGIWGTNDTGEGDGMPTDGETNFDRTDLHESDQIGLTGFKMNRISPGQGNPSTEQDYIVFFDDGRAWPRRLWEHFTNVDPGARFDSTLVANYNLGFLFASGPFKLAAGKTERFSLALGYGGDLDELRRSVRTVQQIYNANYQFAVPPPMPSVHAEAGDGYVRLTWDDVAERGVDPVTLKNDFEGYRIYRSTEPFFLDPKVVSNARGTGPIGHGRPIAQFDLKNGIKEFSQQMVEGVGYYLGDDAGITHTWVDSSVTNGQLYNYAITSYDHGSDSLEFYPSENAITISRTARGGVILPQNAVEVRPNPKVLGYAAATTGSLVRRSGIGTGTIETKVVNSDLVPDNHTFNLVFKTDASANIRADFYELIDSTTGKTLISKGTILDGKETGQVGGGILPVINTPQTVLFNSALSGFTPSSQSNTRLKLTYQQVLPINQFRPGFPDNLTITFSGVPLDTSLPAVGRPAKPVRFRIVANTDSGAYRLKTQFRDLDNDSTLSRPDEFFDIVTYLPSAPSTPRATWRVELDTTDQYLRGAIVPPSLGDVFEAIIDKPFGAGDNFTFITAGHTVNVEKAKQEYAYKPYVVPNPYVGSASFEPERFAVAGRGERRIEFRGLPSNAIIRIYTVRGELVQTLHHDGSIDGFVAWNLRTKDNLEIAPGLYVYHVDSKEFGSSIGKFAVIK